MSESSLILSAPLEDSASQVSPQPDVQDTSNEIQPTLSPSQSQQPTTTTPTPSSTARTSSKKFESNTTELPDFTSYKNTSTFTCYGRATGYYADVKLGCRVYHFCTQMDSIGEIRYQRMSYICLEGSIFDQKDLNCVTEPDLKVSCDKAESEYESSNKQFDAREESSPSMSDNLAANIMMNPITRFIAG